MQAAGGRYCPQLNGRRLTGALSSPPIAMLSRTGSKANIGIAHQLFRGLRSATQKWVIPAAPDGEWLRVMLSLEWAISGRLPATKEFKLLETK